MAAEISDFDINAMQRTQHNEEKEEKDSPVKNNDDLFNTVLSILDVKKIFPQAKPEQLHLAVAVLQDDEKKVKKLLDKKYTKVFTGKYDWAAMILMLLLAFASDVTALYKNSDSGGSSASREFDTVYIGIASSIIMLVSHIDNFRKHFKLGIDAIIGFVFGLHRLLISLWEGWKGSEHITLYHGMFAVYVVSIFIVDKKYVGNVTAAMIYLNLVANCVILGIYYPIPLMGIVLILIRGDVKPKKFLKNNETLLYGAIGVILSIMFVYMLLRSGK